MKQFYLRYQQDSEKSDTPFAVRIAVSLKPVQDRMPTSQISLDFQDRIYSECDSPEEIIRYLEERIADVGCYNPLKYSFNYTTSHWQKKFTQKEHHMDFPPIRLLSLSGETGETAEIAEQKAKKYYKSLHNNIFPLYSQFIRKHTPYSEMEE